MAPDEELTLQFGEQLTWSKDQLCPHGRICGLLGASTAAAMLDYVVEHENDFRAGMVRNRGSDERRVEPALLQSRVMRGLGPFQERVATVMRDVAPIAVKRLGLLEAAVEPREFEFASYGDGGHFKVHLDTADSKRLRILSCVYYFSLTPRRFSGGELRLHGFAVPSRGPARPTIDIAPETDMLVMFPSWMEHEVLPVHVPSGAWMDHRFSFNCWIHRTNH